jgi:hypothetical protein
VSNNAFYFKELDAEVRFDGNDQIVLFQGGQSIPAKRIK